MYIATIVYYSNKRNSKKVMVCADFNELLAREQKEIDKLKKADSRLKVDKIIYEYPSGKQFVKNF